MSLNDNDGLGKDSESFLSGNKWPIIFTLIVLIIGSVLYFTTGASRSTMKSTSSFDVNQLSLLENVKIKTAYTPEGNMKIFAVAKNNDLRDMRTSEGNSVPEYNSIVVGSAEAKMMREEKLFKNPGDELKGLFGIDTKVEGVLSETGTFIDDMHFVSDEEYVKMDAEENVLFVKFKDSKTPKIFYLYDTNQPSPVKIVLSEGNMNLFYTHLIGNKLYHPVILGSSEAKMMREEKLFANTGDTIEGFFGKDVIIVGVINKTGTALDMSHVVEKDFFEESLEPVKGVLA